MNTARLLDRIKQIRPWKRAGERAPHKPFLVLYALGQFQNGVTQIVYAEHEEQLKKLFADFGPPRRPTMSNPFTRLVNDRLWQVSALEDIEPNGTYSDKDLRDMRATGGFPPEVLKTLKSNPGAVREIAELLLEKNFPDSWHNDLLAAAGIDFEFTTTGKKRMRDPNFRDVVLEAYGRTCAICGFQIRRDDQLVGLEAAHIKWRQFNGPDLPQNGIAMCVMHHKLFDFGLFALNEDLQFKVSRKANGGFGLQEWLLDYHNKPIRRPISAKDYPEQEYTQWQVNEVFKGDYRD